MRGYDITIVRLLPFLLFLDIGFRSMLAINGIYLDHYKFIHGNSAIYATALYFISLANRHYHCKWNRAMYLFLIIVPVFNYLDAKFNLVPSAEVYLWIFHIAYGLIAIITAYKAINHFLPTLKKRYG